MPSRLEGPAAYDQGYLFLVIRRATLRGSRMALSGPYSRHICTSPARRRAILRADVIYRKESMFGVRYAVAGAIGGYQRWISPYKGFHCAHRTLHGGESCSAFGKRLVIEHGIRGFLHSMQRRFDSCQRAALALRVQRQALICLANDVRPGDTVDQQAEDGNSYDSSKKKRKDNDGCLVEDCLTSCNFLPFFHIRCSGD